MASWSTVLEALHSATIDVLNRRFPETQVLLGLPKKTTGAPAPPDPSCTLVFRTQISCPDLGTAWVILASDPSLDPVTLWDEVRNEACATAFPQRGLTLRFHESPESHTSQTIWIPFGIHESRLLLALSM